MSIIIKRNRIIFKVKMVSIGIDMQKNSWRVTALFESL
jgi:hypothetical protein